MTLRVDEPLLSGQDAGRRSAFLKAADLGACEIDAAGRLSGCEICWRVLGWRDEARDSGSVSRLLDTIHPEDRDKAAAAIERALCDGARLEIVFRIPGPNGRTRIVGLRGSASADASSRRVLGVIADITDLRREQDEKRRSEQRDIVVRELGHRLRNLFPVILAMVKLTAQSHCSVADYRLALERRLRALAAAERLLTRGAAESASVEELVRTEIAPFDGDDTHEIVIEGPDVTLRGGMAQSFAMIVHELATNAVKHGSLSVRSGRLRAAWRLQDVPGEGRCFVFTWTERNGPTPQRPSRKGFGSLVIAESGTSLLGGRAKSDLSDEGFTYELLIPFGEELASDQRRPAPRRA
jgi:two-component sensor histidine kinase